ncbi:MAG: hypothetical protein K6U11_08830 [bacterium]|nr:hypothetical protein [bacterium]
MGNDHFNDNFLVKEFETLTGNLNYISNDLLKAKWYFLATLAALGLGYKYILELNNNIFSSEQFPFLLVIIFIAGDVVLWLIGEYILSHGFLFRYIQSKLAEIEKAEIEHYLYYKNIIIDSRFKELVKDPRKRDNFLFKDKDGKKESKDGKKESKDGEKESKDVNQERLFFDFFIPDQFIPLYWASIWGILINGLSAYIVYKILYKYDNYKIILPLIIFISLLFISKLWDYHLYKLNKFVEEFCDFKIFFDENKNESIFRFPHIILGKKVRLVLFVLAVLLVFAMLLCFFSESLIFLMDWLLEIINLPFIAVALILILLFWRVVLGLSIHFVRDFVPIIKWDELKDWAPYIDNNNELVLNCGRPWLKKICWSLWLLFFLP